MIAEVDRFSACLGADRITRSIVQVFAYPVSQFHNVDSVCVWLLRKPHRCIIEDILRERTTFATYYDFVAVFFERGKNGLGRSC